MTDAEASQIVLKWFYDNQAKLGWSSLKLRPEMFEGRFDWPLLHRSARRLCDRGLVKATYSPEVPFNPNHPIHPLAITNAGIDAIQYPARSPGVSETDKLRALLQAVADDNNPDEVECFGDKWERYHMLKEAKESKLLDVTFSEDGTSFHPRLLPRGRSVLSGDLPSPYDLSPMNQINNFHAPINGPVQIGNNNIQNIDNRLQAVLQAIEEADIPEEEKAEARSALLGFVSHPAVGNAITGAGLLAQILQAAGSGS